MGVTPQHLPFFRVLPKSVPGPTKRIRVLKEGFSKANRKDQVLVIGFDTEYQSIPGQTDNQVISYQFSAEVLDADPSTSSGNEWSGVVLPNSLELADRFSIPDFLSIVISEGFAQYPDIKIPTTVYLFAHYTNADIPAFSEFKDDQNRSNLNLQNIRKTFVNVSHDIRCYIPDTITNEPIELKLLIRDTMHIAAGGKSLDAVGQLIEIPKIKLSDDPVTELEMKSNMLQLYESDWELFRRYALQDAVIAHRYAVMIVRQYQTLTGRFKFPLTLTSIGVDLLIKNWEDERSNPSLQTFLRDHPWDGLSLVGREKHIERVWSDKHRRYIQFSTTPLMKKLFWREAFFTDGYHGGRNEQFWFGPLPEGVWYDYDLTSAYPSVMSLIGYPLWDKIRSIKNTKELLSLKHVDLAVANVDFEFPPTVRYPCLPLRTEGGLIFPRSGNTTCHISEILVAAHLGAKIKMVEGMVVPTIRHSMSGTAVRPFLSFTQECVRKRRTFPKGTLENAFWKEMVNATYGKTAQGLQRRRVYDLRSGETKDLKPSKITNPFYASMITGFCRATLAEIMNALPEDVHICSVTTDGFATNATPAQMDEATSTLVKGFPWEGDDCDFEQYPPNTCAGFYREASKLLPGLAPYAPGQNPIYEAKHVCKQLLGWRTRGQATLKPAEQSELDAAGLTKDDERLVFAATGLDFPKHYSKADRNAETIATFLNRAPNMVIPKTRLHGIRAMYLEGLDATTYQTGLSVSMEYDWKRRPTSAVDFDLSDHGCSHLQFQTVPWDDIVQYNEVRSNWRQYTKDAPRCLKTIADLKAFNTYSSSHRSLEKSGAGRYLRREGGDLKRLREQISIAQCLRRAGTQRLKAHAFGNQKIFPTKKLTSQELTDFLVRVGVPCRKSDVDNARRKGFIPKQVPRNDATETVLRTLKNEVFPDLVIPDFLTDEVVDFYLEADKK
jgi:hypothetical protein